MTPSLPPDLIPYVAARDAISAAVETRPSIRVGLDQARGSVLAEAIATPTDIPSFDHSAMDGYAVRSVDVTHPPTNLTVTGVSAAGHPASVTAGAGQAVRILTGAVMVDGADAVVRVEDTDAGVDKVEIRVAIEPGANVRRAGESARRGDVLITTGTLLNAGHLGVAAGCGLTEVAVVSPPRVAVISAGDELVPPGGQTLRPGQIHESNSTVLAELVRQMGCPVDVRHCGDDVAELQALLADAAADHDVIISSAGISMGGEYDTMRRALADHPVELWTVAIRPAKPFAFGTVHGARLFGLPGNPVSSVVAFEALVRPALRKMLGLTPHVLPMVRGIAGQDFGGGTGRTQFLRVRRDGTGHWVSTGPHGPNVLHGLADAEAFAVVAPDGPDVTFGSEIDLLPLWT